MIRVAESVSYSRLDDELVLLDGRTGLYFGLNQVGSRIFELLKATGDAARVVAALGLEFDAPTERLRADVDAFIALLRAKRFITDESA